MSRILLAWELGGGFGHLAPFLSLAPRLLERGHTLQIAAREIGSAHKAIGDLPITVHQAPLCLKNYSGLQEPPLNFAEILMRYGYLDPPMLRAMVAAWRALLEATRSDLLIADHAPTAMLAARWSSMPSAVIGTPFSVPPEVHPTPNMRQWLEVPAQRLADSDARVLAGVNAILPVGKAPFKAIHGIFSGAAQFFLGVPETDLYGPRNTAVYLGPNSRSTGTALPAWPGGAGKRILAYLRGDYKHLEATIRALVVDGTRVIAYVPGANQKLLHLMATLGATVAMEAVDMVRLLPQADICVAHGPGTAFASIRAGVPVMMLPTQLENFLLAQALQRMGIGTLIHPDQDSPDFAGVLAEMLASDKYAVSARVFAAQYPDTVIDEKVEQVVTRIEALCAAHAI